MKVTPYNAQIVYMESIRMSKKEINLETFLLRCDLLNVKDFIGIKEEEISQYQIITTCLMEVIKLNNMVKDSPLAMYNYMTGINTGANATDNILRNMGETPMKDYLDLKGFGSNPVIKYMFLTLTGRYTERDKLNKQLMKDFILERKVTEELPELDKILHKINYELEEIEGIVNTQKRVKTSLDVTEITQTIERIRESFNRSKDDVAVEGLEQIEEIERTLHNLLIKAQEQEKITVGVSDNIRNSANKYRQTIELIDHSLNRSNVTMGHALTQQQGFVVELEKGKSSIAESLSLAQENFEHLIELQKEIDIQGIIRDVDKIINTNKDLKEHTSEHASLIQGVSIRIVHVQKSLAVLEEVMEGLNRLVRREAILGLSQTESQVNKMTNHLGGM